MALFSKKNSTQVSSGNGRAQASASRLGLYVLLGVAAGVVVGLTFGSGEIVAGITAADLGAAGKLVIQLLKLVAVPLILFGIIDAILRTDISWRSGRNLLLICLFNVSIAFVIGLTLMNTIEPGRQVQGRIQEVLGLLKVESSNAAAPARLLKMVNDWFPNTPTSVMSLCWESPVAPWSAAPVLDNFAWGTTDWNTCSKESLPLMKAS